MKWITGGWTEKGLGYLDIVARLAHHMARLAVALRQRRSDTWSPET